MFGQQLGRRRMIPLAVVLLSFGVGHAQISTHWHYDSAAAITSRPSVSIGANGSQVVFSLSGSGSIKTFVGGSAPESPLIFESTLGSNERFSQVASARAADLHAVLSFQPQATGGLLVPVLRAYRSSIVGALWTRTFGPVSLVNGQVARGISVSSDGQRIAAWWAESSSIPRVVTFSADGSQRPTAALPPWSQPRAAVLSADGGRLCLSCNLGLVTIDTESGTVFGAQSGWASPSIPLASAVSDDTIAFGNIYGGVDVFGATTSPAMGFEFTMPPGTAGLVQAMDLSADGAVMAVGYEDTNNLLAQHVRIIDVNTPGHPVRLEDTLTGQGAYFTFITDIACSPTGDWIAIGTTGDQFGALPELVLYRRIGTTSFERIDVDLPGSVYDLEIASNSTLLTVVSANRHIDAGATLASIDAFDLRGEIACSGVPHAGTTTHVEVKSVPGRRCLLIRGDALAATPFTTPGMAGSMYITNPHMISGSVADSQGVAHIPFAVPGAIEIGRTIYFQGLALVNRRLTASWTALTVVP